MLDATLTATLKTYLERVTFPIELEASLDDGAVSGQTRELLAEIAALSDKITVTAGDDARTPSFAIKRVDSDIAVRFAGERLEWDAAKLQFSNNKAASKLVSKEYRKGWELPTV